MITIEELASGQVDAVSSATLSWDEDNLDLVRQAPEGQTAYDFILAQMSQESASPEEDE